MGAECLRPPLLQRCFQHSRCQQRAPFPSTTTRIVRINRKCPRQTSTICCQQVATQSVDTVAQHQQVYSWKRPKELTRVQAPSNAPPIVILPGFGNCSSDYVAPFGLKEEGIAHFLQQRGFDVYVVDIERRDWIQVARCIASRAYWTGKSTVDPGYRWYLHRVQAAIDKACKECDSDQVDLIGHSAGGWLARAFVGDALYMKSSPKAGNGPAAEPHVAPGLGVGRLPSRVHEGVRRLITLGTPHLGPSTGGRDMTGGTLTWLNTQWPGAFFKDQGIQYTCVAGQLVAGNREAANRSLAKYACNSYREVCGDGHGQLGDGVVPRCCAHLEGADNLLLEGVFHSISKKGTFADRSQLVWYGSDDVIDAWLHALL